MQDMVDEVVKGLSTFDSHVLSFKFLIFQTSESSPSHGTSNRTLQTIL